MTKLEERLRARFTPDINAQLVSLFKRSYEANADCYDPSIGHDNMVFGLLIHKSAKYFISQLALFNSWVRIVQLNPRFLFKIDEFLLSSYRVGDTIDFDITSAFPANTGGAPMLALANRRQLSFEFMKDGSMIRTAVI
jgi:hypothetical protein